MSEQFTLLLPWGQSPSPVALPGVRTIPNGSAQTRRSPGIASQTVQNQGVAPATLTFGESLFFTIYAEPFLFGTALRRQNGEGIKKRASVSPHSPLGGVLTVR